MYELVRLWMGMSDCATALGRYARLLLVWLRDVQGGLRHTLCVAVARFAVVLQIRINPSCKRWENGKSSSVSTQMG